MPDNLTKALRLVLVTDDRLLADRDPVAVAIAAVAGGITAVQLRLKHAGPRALVELARRLRQAVPVPVLVNDRPDLAAAAGVGVHLGPDDLAPALARVILPAGTILGASVGSRAEAPRGMAADYWGVGPWRSTGTKSDAGEPLGAVGFAAIAELAQDRPCVAIGGVRPEDLPAIMAAGGTGVAVISGILGADDVEAAAQRYSDAIDRAVSGS
jgi:thiamine-phosphate pyrophosphorylase